MKKTALITGCAKGIGREIALDLARSGYNIIGTYNTSLKEINELKNKVESIGVNFDFYKLDISDEKNIKPTLARTGKKCLVGLRVGVR